MFTKQSRFPFFHFKKYNLIDAWNYSHKVATRKKLDLSTLEGVKKQASYTNRFIKVRSFFGLYDHGKPFKPNALYVSGMDMLVFLTKDCSYTLYEESNFGGILVENHDDGISIVGFQLYGIQYFSHKRGELLVGACPVTPLVEWIVSNTEGGFQKVFGEYHFLVRELLTKHPKLEVSIPS